MKKFLTICIIAMTSAGIYGFIDMGREIHNGTMIQYDDLSAPSVKALTHARTQRQAINNSIFEKLAVIAANKKKEEDASKAKLEILNMKFEDFSRGEGVYMPNVELVPLEEQVTTSGTDAKVDTVKAVTPPSTAQVIQVSDETPSLTTVEEPSLNERMFSRGSPKYYKKKTLAMNKSKE